MRVLSTLCVILGMFIGTAGLAANSDIDVQNERLDKAGRERMIIQRMVKGACFVMSGIRTEELADLVIKDASTFDSVLDALSNGSGVLGWEKETNPSVVEALDAVSILWGRLGPAAMQVAHGDMHNFAVTQILNETDATATAMNNAVSALAKSISTGDKASRAAMTLNVAGRQRMLTQKMAKEFCFIANEISVEQNVTRLKGTIKLFDDSLTAIRKAKRKGDGLLPANTNGRYVLEGIQHMWTELEEILSKAVETGTASRDDLEDVSKRSEQMLKAMIFVVDMYVEMLSKES